MNALKKMISKIALLGMALVFAMSLVTTAHAAERKFSSTSTGTLTVNNVPEGTTVNAYQVITVSVDDASATPEYPMYTWNAQVATWLKSQKDYKKFIDDGGKVTAEFGKMNDATIKKFWSDLAAVVKTFNTITPLTSNTVTAEKKVVFDNVAMGEYLVIADNEKWTFLPTTAYLIPTHNGTEWVVKNGECSLKGSSTDPETNPETSKKPSIQKSVAEKTFAIGDTLHYTLNVTAPLYAESATNKTFDIADVLPKGFQFKNDVVVRVGNTFSTAATTVESTNYTVATTTNGFTVTFKPEFYNTYAKVDNNGDVTNNKVVITYSAMVTSVADSYDDKNGDANKADKTNTATLTFNHAQYGDPANTSISATATSYTFAANIKKVANDGTTLITAPAEFKLTKQDGTLVKFFTVDGVCYVAGDDKSDALDVLTTVNGKLDIKGLGEGDYVLTETKAPSGYVLPKGTITFNVKDTASNHGILASDVTVVNAGKAEFVNAAAENNTVKFDVKNKTQSDIGGTTLPATGGMGTMIFTIGGLCVMAAAVGLGVYLNKKKHC